MEIRGGLRGCWEGEVVAEEGQEDVVRRSMRRRLALGGGRRTDLFVGHLEKASGKEA